MALLLPRRAASTMATVRLQQHKLKRVTMARVVLPQLEQLRQQRSISSSSMIARCRISDRKPILAGSNAPGILDSTSRQEPNCVHPIRVFSMQFSTSSENNNDKNEDKDTPAFDVPVDYTSPLGDLISRLKMVSITGCFLSVFVMPALVFLKNGDLPNAQQATMGTVATLGAVGSTAALHFVFGAYVLEMKSVLPEQAASDNENNNHSAARPKLLLHAKTRSVFGFWNNDHVFDPTTDVQAYQGNRPFANFMVHGQQPLYVHPEKLDSITKQWLLLQQQPPPSDNSATEATDSEGLATKTKKKKKDDDDDEFF